MMHVLPGNWVFICKRSPDGSERMQAIFCVMGYRLIEGVDYFETFAPVVNWNNVSLLLNLSIVVDLETKRVDYTCAFYKQKLIERVLKIGVYLSMPMGF